MLFFGVCFFLYFIKLSGGNVRISNINGDSQNHNVKLSYIISALLTLFSRPTGCRSY